MRNTLRGTVRGRKQREAPARGADGRSERRHAAFALLRRRRSGVNGFGEVPAFCCYRTFSVARPIIARMSEMIQKRITICGSFQPFFS